MMIKCCFKNSFVSFALIALVSFAALTAAFIAEGFLGLEPCRLCIYQRYPFAIGIILGLIGLIYGRNNTVITKIMFSACGLNFMINSGIAAYHTGVEQHWWTSGVEGCAAPIFEESSGKSILENLMSTPLGSCSEIPWQDPLLGLSMANYNIALCFGLFMFSALCAAPYFKRNIS